MAERWHFTPARIALLYVSGVLLGAHVTGIVWSSIEGANPMWPTLGAIAMLLLSVGNALYSRQQKGGKTE
jgi:F0F1-type ATP synthase assembly protein I